MQYNPIHHYHLHEIHTYNNSLDITHVQIVDLYTNHEYSVFFHQQFEYQYSTYQSLQKKSLRILN